MSKTGRVHGSCCGIYLYDRLPRRRPCCPYFSRAAAIFPARAALPKGGVDWRSGLFSELLHEFP